MAKAGYYFGFRQFSYPVFSAKDKGDQFSAAPVGPYASQSEAERAIKSEFHWDAATSSVFYALNKKEAQIEAEKLTPSYL